MPPRHGHKPVHLQVLGGRADLAGVEPENIDRAVAGRQFFDLAVGVLDEPGPFLGVRLGVVVRVAGPRRGGGVPVVGVMPVGFGEINADAELLLAKGVKDSARHVGPGVGVERDVGPGDAKVGLLGVEHAEAVVVLGGEDDVLHAGGLGHACPSGGVEPGGIERAGQSPVIAPEAVDVLAALGPGLEVIGARPAVFLDQRPRLDTAPLAVRAPVHHEAELEILKPLQAFREPGLLRRSPGVSSWGTRRREPGGGCKGDESRESASRS